MTIFRKQLFDYINKKYNISPEHLWSRYPGYAVFRHSDNRKWFALVMNIPKSRLGLCGEEMTDILNVKMSDPFIADFLIQQEGFFRGYHIRGGNWISVLLDGTVEFEEICRWLEESYAATASKETRHKIRPPKEWLIPANPIYYDVERAFSESDEINWKQGRGIRTGDTVFLYVAAPISAILYKCLVTNTDIPAHFDDGKIHIDNIMKIKLMKRYSPDKFTFEILGREYGIFAVRGPRGIPDRLSKALK